MEQCLVVEDDPDHRERFVGQLACFYDPQGIEAPASLTAFEVVLEEYRQWKVVLLDGLLWLGKSWIEFDQAILRQMSPDGVIICVSGMDIVAKLMKRKFGSVPVYYAGKRQADLDHILRGLR